MSNNSINTGVTIYEMQKKKYAEVKPLDMLDVISRIEEVSDKMLNSDIAYFTLLCHENRDYTTFVLTSNTEKDNLKQSLLETIQNRGEIMDIYDNGENCWDIWIRNITTKETFLMKLFDYSDFIEIV